MPDGLRPDQSEVSRLIVDGYRCLVSPERISSDVPDSLKRETTCEACGQKLEIRYERPSDVPGMAKRRRMIGLGFAFAVPVAVYLLFQVDHDRSEPVVLGFGALSFVVVLWAVLKAEDSDLAPAAYCVDPSRDHSLVPEASVAAAERWESDD